MSDFVKRVARAVTGSDDDEQDDAMAPSGDAGGSPDEDAPDQQSTTGTTPDEGYVGRIAGQDVGYAGETGAEARAEAGKSTESRHDR